MGKNIIVLSDGTGNAASSLWRTNVWRLFQTLDLSGNSQVARYDDGVGSSSFLPLALIGGAFGYGLKRNVIDLYKFICRNYTEGDRIYAFGFSRGAYTVRVLVGLIGKQGLVRADSEEELNGLARDAYRAYRAAGYNTIWHIEVPFRWLRDRAIGVFRRLRGQPKYDHESNHKARIAFIGVWDTVSAYGLPVDEMTRGVSRWLWPLELPDRVLSSKVDRACHALSLDDQRTTFHPLLWTEDAESAKAGGEHANISQERISQVWFLGMHANVGGGYPDDALAHIPLAWMLEQVKEELTFKEPPFAQYDEVKQLATVADKDGRMYDSRSGLGIIYRYGPRSLDALCHVPSPDRREAVQIARPKIHCSVFERMISGSADYVPLGLPHSYDVVTSHGEILQAGKHSYETPAHAVARARLQEAAWNFIWFGRWVYFVMLAAILYLAAFPWFNNRGGDAEYSSPIRLVSELTRVTESVLPSGVHWWTDWYAANPIKFALVILLIAFCVALASWLRSAAAASMRRAWQLAEAGPVSLGRWHSALYACRTSTAYVATISFLKRKFFPGLFALVFAWLIIGWGSHLVFNILDSAGVFCKERQGPLQVLKYDNATSRVVRFATNDPCARLGVSVEANQRYSITINVVEPWKDWWIPIDPKGRKFSEGPTLLDKSLWFLGTPFRRVFFRGWFLPIARVGAKGNAEYFLDVTPSAKGDGFVGQFKTERSGELFLYVNDIVLPLPWLYRLFYWNNQGVALVQITRQCDAGCKERTLKFKKEQCHKKCGPQPMSLKGTEKADWSVCYLECAEGATSQQGGR